MGFGLRGPRVALVPLEKDRHLENAYRWMNDLEVTRNLAVGWRPMTRYDEEQFFESMAKSQSDLVMAIETLEGAHIGFSGLHSIDYRLGSAKTGTVIGPHEARKQGYGVEAGHLRCFLAFEEIGLRMLYSEYYQGNEASQKMQEKLGYQVWGVMPDGNFRRGQFLDVVCTHLRAETWRERRPDWLRYS